MLVDINWIEENYNKYNEIYWEGKLPKNLKFIVSNAKNTWGYASYRYDLIDETITPLAITLSNYYDSTEHVKLNTLLHEMVHIADYTFNPHHFIKNHKKVRYDAHGPLFFLKEAARLNNDGWDIQRYVQDWEKEGSELSQKEKERMEKKTANGITFYIFKFTSPTKASDGKMYNYGYSKPAVKNIVEAENYYHYLYNSENIEYCDKYISRSESAYVLRQLKGARRYFLTDEIEDVINEYELNFVKRLFGEEDIEKSSDLIPLFLMKLSNGNEVNYKHISKDDLISKLKERFPKWSDETIEKILSNDSFFPEGKGNDLNENIMNRKLILNEKQFNFILNNKILSEELDEDVIDEGDIMDDDMVHVNPINDEEGIVSIE